MGFAAAYSRYHPDFGDIDNDGDMDIIFGASNAQECLCLNSGTMSIPSFQFITSQYIDPGEYSNVCPPVFVDIDADDDLDIFTGFNNGYLVFFENVGSPDSAIYQYITGDYLGVVLPYGCPSHDFVDIDDDGDYDYFAGTISQTFGELTFFMNEGTPNISDLQLVTINFENIDVGGRSAPEFCDIDSDGDYDLFIGCDAGNVWYYENIGDSVNYNFEYVTNNYFNIDVGLVSVPRFCDIDDDDDFDLFVANESSGGSVGFAGDMDFYENIGTATDPDFQFVTGQYLFMDMNSVSSPYLIDIDDDGLMEILCGITSGDIIYFENSGTNSQPSFYYADSCYLNLSLAYQPTFAFKDLDSDNDYDMVVKHGFFNDSFIDLYTNIGTSFNPILEFSMNVAFLEDIGNGGMDLVDIDADSDYDLFFSDGDNLIHYWENVGDSLRPRFEFFSNNYLNQIPGGFGLYPRFIDVDHDVDYDLIIDYSHGSASVGYIIFWRNTGTPQVASFTLEDTLFTFSEIEPGILKPCFADIDNDGDEDMFLGEDGGAMLFYRNLENPYQAQLNISIQGSDVILTWGSIAEAVEYKIFYRDIPYFTPEGTPQITVFPPDTSWTDYGAVNEGGRYYRVVVEGQ